MRSSNWPPCIGYLGIAFAGTRTRRSLPRGFSLIEALVAIAVLGLSASALILATQSSADAARWTLERTCALGVAETLLDEALGLPYCEPGDSASRWPIGPEYAEAAPTRRDRFDDIDDFDGYTTIGAFDAWAVPWGQGDGSGGHRPAPLRIPFQRFQDWRIAVRVFYVDDEDVSRELPRGSTSSTRCIEVAIDAQQGTELRPLARVRRVCAYVPPCNAS